MLGDKSQGSAGKPGATLEGQAVTGVTGQGVFRTYANLRILA
jgi:hypothetical protein